MDQAVQSVKPGGSAWTHHWPSKYAGVITALA
jgi:hypothetical protein